MDGMFYGAKNFNSDISNWNIARVTNMESMFESASKFNQTLCPWGPKLPLNFDYAANAGFMFDSSGCLDKNSPTGPAGPWCAVTNCTA
jgi:surface protein